MKNCELLDNGPIYGVESETEVSDAILVIKERNERYE
jgi:hypothetical protein